MIFERAIINIGNNVPIDSKKFDYNGDRNLTRDQGQIIIHSNFLTNSRDWGIVADAGPREFERGVPHGFLQTHPGAVRKLRQLNNTPNGGLLPGATIENNVISGEGLGGIFFSGAVQPYEITPLRPNAFPRQNISNATSGDRVTDGTTFTIQMHRTEVTFEFDDIGGSPRPLGSAITGGNGWAEGNIPVFYRRSGQNYLNRSIGYTQTEMATAIRDAIQGSILVTNGTTMHLEADQFLSRAWGDPDEGADPAVFLTNAVAVTSNGTDPCTFNHPSAGNSCGFSGRHVTVADSPQPFGRLLNNTVYGDDGNSSFFVSQGTDEPSDVMSQAIETKQDRSQNPINYITNGVIGDGNSIPADLSRDVDLYRFHLNASERVTVDLDTTFGGGQLDTVLRLFDANGIELAQSEDDPAPGEFAGTSDSYIDFTAAIRGTYYVGVSGAGNNQYDPLALANRNGPASTGDYTLSLDVIAPHKWVVTAVDGSQIIDMLKQKFLNKCERINK